MSLQEMRLKAELSQSQLAIKAGISKRVLQNYEQGRMSIDGAKLKTLLNLAYALNCRLIDILNDEELKDLLRKSKIK